MLFGRFYVNAYIDDHKKRKLEKLMANNNIAEEKNQNVVANGKKHEWKTFLVFVNIIFF